MSLPDHGEFDPPSNKPTVAHINRIDLAINFLRMYQDEGDRRDFDAALTMLERVYVTKYAEQPPKDVKPWAPVFKWLEPQPVFAAKAEPGLIVPITPPTSNHPISDAKPPVLEEEQE